MPFVVRFEDIDGPRVVPGAKDVQLADLAELGLHPDRVYLQTERRQRHWELFQRAVREGVAYACTCSRKEIRDAIEASASAPHSLSAAYNGRCRSGAPERPELPSVAWRFRGEDASGADDVVIARTRGREPDEPSFMPSYPFACAIDDLDGGYALLVRASDLESSARAQRMIQGWMDPHAAPPAIFHASLVVRNDGHRLEKRTRGVTLPELQAAGWSAARLLEAFERSFSANPTEFRPGRIFGETERERTLQSLGLPSLSV
jgi:glutamyl-tRNA synthetase